MATTDRRRANGPAGGTLAPVFDVKASTPPKRSRNADNIRKIFLRTGLVPSASGSAYVEFEHDLSTTTTTDLVQAIPTVKISCAVHGPKPLPRSAPFSSHLVLNTHVKFAPFATRIRRGYIRDSAERDLAAHVETALRGVIIADRWPKSGIDIVLTVLEGDEHDPATTATGAKGFGTSSLGLMSILSGCITAASAALVHAGVDCVDIVTGGVAAAVPAGSASKDEAGQSQLQIVQDPVPTEHIDAVACCVVGYLRSRDEIAELWMNCGNTGKLSSYEVSNMLLEGAVQAAVGAQRVVVEALQGE